MGDDVIRQAVEEDHSEIVAAIGRWWTASRSAAEAQRLGSLVPRLFLQHFASTSFVAETDDRMTGFLVGFPSYDHPDQAYVHFVGVDPERRRAGLARSLYGRFFERASGLGRTQVHCITSPGNRGSIAFHRSLGFRVLNGDGEIDGVPVIQDYDGRGGARVRFVLDLA